MCMHILRLNLYGIYKISYPETHIILLTFWNARQYLTLTPHEELNKKITIFLGISVAL